jgi:8-hydroxy-5-deazaflavin:NADPH oxidoreductase
VSFTIGVIGAGGIGQAFAGQVVRAGYDVILSNSRAPDSLAEVVARLGPRAKAATRLEAAQADVVVIAVRWEQLPAALGDLPPWRGRIVVDTTNAVLQPGFRAADLNGSTSSEVVASMVPGARVVKIANTLLRAVLAANPNEAGGHRVLFMSGDDEAAKKDVAAIVEKAGFATIDLGGLASGGKMQQFPGSALATLNLIKLG